MKQVRINPKILKGAISIPPSKSLCHRGIIAAALSPGESQISNVIFSDDIHATWQGMEILGAKIEDMGNGVLKIKGNQVDVEDEINIDSKESGSSLRFLIPISMLNNKTKVFTGRGKLVSRPLESYYKIFNEQAIIYSSENGNLPLKVQGKLNPGDFEIEGNISSQFITGLLFTLPLLDGNSRIIVKGDLESKGYVDLTLDTLNNFGINIENNVYQEFLINGNQKYEARDYRVEGDFSQAAFWLVAGIIGEEITSLDLNIDSLQGDKAIIDLIKEMGGDIEITKDKVITRRSTTRGIEIDASQCPDIVPILTVLAALSEGETRIVNAARLRIKESDRLKAISTELNKLGADIVELEDGLVIQGKKSLMGGIVDSWNDHRIAMSLAIASLRCKEEVIITNSDSVNKSYPHFWEDFKKLGGNIHELNMGK